VSESSKPRAEPLDGLIGVARRRLDGEDGSHDRQERIRQLQVVMDARRAQRTYVRRWSPRFALVLVAAAAVVMILSHRRDPRLALDVLHGTLASTGYIQSMDQGGAELRFSDGTRVNLRDDTRLRVSSISNVGARLLLENGSSHVVVVHRPKAEWTIEAGPYEVMVTGTEFDVAWSAADEVFELRMQRGSVLVRGPLLPANAMVNTDQSLLVRLRDGQAQWTTRPASGIAPTSSAEPLSPAAGEPGSASTTSDQHPPAAAESGRGAAGTPAASASASWGNLFSTGDFAGIVQQAEALGIERAVAESSQRNLAALADAARYARRNDVARKALGAERKRFPKSAQAHDAAFFLGGVSESEGSLERAVEWYARYLEEEPRGTYASEALGRKMIAVHRSQGVEPARPIARTYLDRFPKGPYASAAQELVNRP
jgi:TolA-binding protein